MTEIETLRLINLVRDGKITEEMFGKIMTLYNENHKKSEQFLEWQRIAELRKQVLLAMGFEQAMVHKNHFTKINAERTSEGAQFVAFGFRYMDEGKCAAIKEEIYAIDKAWPEGKILGIIEIIQNPDQYPDLIEYLRIRDNTPAMEKFLEQAEKE